VGGPNPCQAARCQISPEAEVVIAPGIMDRDVLWGAWDGLSQAWMAGFGYSDTVISRRRKSGLSHLCAMRMVGEEAVGCVLALPWKGYDGGGEMKRGSHPSNGVRLKHSYLRH
jgi:hypothetical protein